jgi:class 3 adenylate cyclase
MRYAQCGTDNRDVAKFYAKCGTKLLPMCPSYEAKNRLEANFSDSCGARFGETSPKVEEPAPGKRVSDERRHLTVLFCDLVGSTEIAARLDPEEWRETVAGYHRAAAEEITRFGGHIVKYLGDGVMALFGYPEAHENDAERAARAGLVQRMPIQRTCRS